MKEKQPYIVEETGDFAVVFKPPQMHCVPLKQKTNESLQEWYTAVFPGIEKYGGAPVHRLDFDTHGLALFAKNKESLAFFQSLQEKGEFVKEYGAICCKTAKKLSGFPPEPVFAERPFVIESFFRPFGPGRKQVRPVTDGKYREIAKDRGSYYRTEVSRAEDNVFVLKIKRGFRHQIRCHLCWAGFPILNDPIYGTAPQEKAFLALRAQALFFADPKSGLKRESRIASIENIPFFVQK